MTITAFSSEMKMSLPPASHQGSLIPLRRSNHARGVRYVWSNGFTLIELLAVLGIVAIVTGIASTAILGVINSTRLTQAGDELAGLISQAQQIAISESRPVEVRFYRLRESAGLAAPGQTSQVRGVLVVKYFQTGEPDPTSATGTPLTNPKAIADFGGLHRLPAGVVMSTSNALNSFMKLPETATSANGNSELMVKNGKAYEPMTISEAEGYRSFLCLPESTDLNTQDTWFVTLIDANSANASPTDLKNFYTIQIDPVSGRLMSYRP
jgi:uncharacterized protein (TIGR02596 family)